MSIADHFKEVMEAAQSQMPPTFEGENVRAHVTEHGECHIDSTPVSIQCSASVAAALGRWLVSTFE